MCQVSSDLACLRQISSIISDSDVSSFEIIHSGLITKLISYLTSLTPDQRSCRNDRIRVFLHIFASCPVRSRHAILNNANDFYDRFAYFQFIQLSIIYTVAIHVIIIWAELCTTVVNTLCKWKMQYIRFKVVNIL